jgi:co-chaperonin GroES (HSP10)
MKDNLDIDLIKPEMSLIELENTQESSGYDIELPEWALNFVYDDVVLVSISADSAANYQTVGGIIVQTNMSDKRRAWTRGEVVLVGPACKHTSVGDIVLFSEANGTSANNLNVQGRGIIRKGRFLNEATLFAKMVKKNTDK